MVDRPQHDETLAWRGETTCRSHRSAPSFRPNRLAPSPSQRSPGAARSCGRGSRRWPGQMKRASHKCNRWVASSAPWLGCTRTTAINRDRGREGRSGRVFVAKTLLSSATADMAPYIDAGLRRGGPIVGVLRAQPASSGGAGSHTRPTGPPPIGPYHALQDGAPPVAEAHRQWST